MGRDVDTAAAAALIANPARAAMLDALFDGGEHPAGALARAAGVAPSTASAHLARLEQGGLVVIERRGRESRVRLAGALGAAVCTEILARGWVERMPEPRALRLTSDGERGLADAFGVAL